MAKPNDPSVEAEERLQRVRERRAVIERLPEGAQRQRMLEENTMAAMKAEAELNTARGGATETLWDRGTRAVGDWFSEKLLIEESFNDAAATGLTDGNMGPLDRARHLIWASKLAERYGPAAAMAITTAKEGENLIMDPFKMLRHVGGNQFDTAQINEMQFEALKETGRDFKTNIFAIRNMPRDPKTGEPRAFTPEEARKIVEQLDVQKTPLETRNVAGVPTGVLPNEREVTTTQYGERPDAPVFNDRIDQEMELFRNATPEQRQQMLEVEQRIRAERDLAETPPMSADEFRQKALPLSRPEGGAPNFSDQNPQFTTGGGPGRPGQIVGGAKKFTFREDI